MGVPGGMTMDRGRRKVWMMMWMKARIIVLVRRLELRKEVAMGFTNLVRRRC